MKKYRKGWGWKPLEQKEYPIEEMLELVNCGEARLKASHTIENELLINIIPKENYVYEGDYEFYYAERIPNMSIKEFNKKYGKDYIDNWNYYL